MGKYCMVKISVIAVVIHYFFHYGSYIFAVLGEVFTFTAAILPPFGRPMCSVALPGVSAGACKCHRRRSAGCRVVLNVREVFGLDCPLLELNWTCPSTFLTGLCVSVMSNDSLVVIYRMASVQLQNCSLCVCNINLDWSMGNPIWEYPILQLQPNPNPNPVRA